MDYQQIRHSDVCPFCLGAKDQGLIVCWPCYRKEGMRHGESDDRRDILNSRERMLAWSAARAS